MDVEEIETVAVLGAGTMGHGIAEVVALAGYQVALRDVEEDLVQEGYRQIEWSLDKLSEGGHLDEDAAAAARERITPLVDLESAVGDADVVVEAVPERMSVKTDVYADLEERAPDRTVFTTNTSSLSITELSEETERPERFCGMHFFNPPVRMDLVEVIAGEHTAEATLTLIEDLAESLDKTPVRVRKDTPGFIVNRVLLPMLNEAAWIVHDDAGTIAEVDSTAKGDLDLPMGAFELADQVGLDVALHILEYMRDELGPAYAPCPLLARKVDANELGRKSDAGFYDYGDDASGPEIPADEGREDLRDRLLAVMANEVAGLLAADVADPPAIDRAMRLGAGFPEGPAYMADDVGLPRVVEVLDHLHDRTGEPRYEAEAYLRELAENDRSFHD